MEIRDFLTMTADLNEDCRIYINQTPPVPAGIIRVTDDAAVFLETKKPLTVKDARKQLNFLKKEQKLMFFINEAPQYVFGLKISNDRILLN